MEEETLEQRMERMMVELKGCGLYEKDIDKRILGYFMGEGEVSLEREFLGEKVRIDLRLGFSMDGEMVLHCYDVMPRKEPMAYEHFVHNGVDTVVLESRFAALDFSVPLDLSVDSPQRQQRQSVIEEINVLKEDYDWEDKVTQIKIDRLLEGMYVKYTAGTYFEKELAEYDRGWNRGFYNIQSFPTAIHVNLPGKYINDHKRLEELSDNAWSFGEKRREIMNANNLEKLKLEMEKLGFSQELVGQMEAKMAANEPKFILYDELQSDQGRVEVGLHFNQSKTSDFYYFNKFDVVLEKQPPLEPGQHYFVSSQRQGEEVQVAEFQMPSLAVKHFNGKMEGAGEIRGTAEIIAGIDASSGRKLVSMADGKIVDVAKDFYVTLKTPAPGQTFYLEKGNGFTLDQGVNLIAGRSVYREDILNVEKKEYSAWVKLELDQTRDRSGNFEMKKMTDGYPFDFAAVLERFDFVELGDPKARQAVETSMQNGNRTLVTVDVNGKKEQLLAVVVPEYKQINLYSLEGRSIKRETHMKEERLPEVGMEKDKGVKKGKEQENGLAV